jgi:cell division protein FtsB
MTARTKLLGVAAVLAGGLSLASVADAKGFRRYLSLRQDVEALQERNRVLASQNEALLREINALRKDPAALERAVREELGYVKPGELVFHLEQEEP